MALYYLASTKPYIWHYIISLLPNGSILSRFYQTLDGMILSCFYHMAVYYLTSTKPYIAVYYLTSTKP